LLTAGPILGPAALAREVCRSATNFFCQLAEAISKTFVQFRAGSQPLETLSVGQEFGG
jgi:hypothetical protein